MDVVEGLETTFATAGGTCANVLALLSWLGWDSFPVARLGFDEPGDFVLEDLRFDGVRTEFVTQEKLTSTPVVVQKFKADVEGHRSHRYVLTCLNAVLVTALQIDNDPASATNHRHQCFAKCLLFQSSLAKRS